MEPEADGDDAKQEQHESKQDDFEQSHGAWNLQQWAWDEYGIAFTLPAGMTVTQNDGETFTAQRSNLFLTMTPILDGTLDVDDLAEAVIAMAISMDYDGIEDADELELGDLIGYDFEGTLGAASAFVIALLDLESESNDLVVIVFDDASRDKAMKR
jgi:hypothetical protein